MAARYSSTTEQESRHETSFADDVLDGLSRRPRVISPKHLYDRLGSELFEEICELDEYYSTRTELQIMKQFLHEMAQAIGPRKVLLELGSGMSLKSRLLIEALDAPVAYIPFDISPTILDEAERELKIEFPDLTIVPLVGDFQQDIEIPDRFSESEVAIYFPGSTIGNLSRTDASALLHNLRRVASGGMLVGFDLQKEVSVLERAYNDSEGVTARFNLNLLNRINRELDGDFNKEAFIHQAIYNSQEQRIEMHLVSLIDQQVHVAGQTFSFAQGDSICTEYSHKYTIESFSQLVQQADFTFDSLWTDPRKWFAVAYLKPNSESTSAQ